MDQKYSSADGPARRNPARKLRPVGMSRVFVDTSYAGGNLDYLTLDPHGLGAICKEAPQRAVRLKADQEDRTAAVP